MIKVYRVFDEVDAELTDEQYLDEVADSYVISILATDETAFYVYPDADSQNLELAQFQSNELDGRITQMVENMTLNGEETPLSADKWAELASYNLGRRTISIFAYDAPDDTPLSEVEEYEKGFIESYLARKARSAV